MKIKYISARPHPGGLVKITAVVEGSLEEITKRADLAAARPCLLKIEPETKKRTLTANGYYWTLIDKLAGSVGASKKDIHRQMLARYGETDTDAHGRPLLFRMAEDINPEELADIYVDAIDHDDGFITYRVLKGSSKMDTKAFSILLDGVISEAREMGIEVLSDEQLQQISEIQKHESRDDRRPL